MFNTNCSSIEHKQKQLTNCLNKSKGNKKFTFPIFENKILSSPKTLKMAKDCFFQPNMMKYVCMFWFPDQDGMPKL